MLNRIIIAIGVEVLVPRSAAGRNRQNSRGIRVDKPTPRRVIIPALEIIQPGLYGADLAARAKLASRKLEITRSNAAFFTVPGEGVPPPGDAVGSTGNLSPWFFLQSQLVFYRMFVMPCFTATDARAGCADAKKNVDVICGMSAP